MDDKKNKSKKKEEAGNAKVFYNPMQLTEELKKLGEKYDRKTAGLYYLLLLSVSIASGFFLELHPVLIVLTAAVYLYFVPQLLYNRYRQAYEKRRFMDANSYMHQMVQSFLRTKHIPLSLEETLNTFTSGRLHDILEEGAALLRDPSSGTWTQEELKDGLDPRMAEDRVLKNIEAEYGCEKLRTLHDFLRKAERRGGESAAEFGLLEKTRMLWENAVEGYHKTLTAERNFGSLMYIFVMLTDIVLMKYLAYVGLDIAEEWITQMVNTAMLILFIVFFVILDKRLNTSLLADPKVMSREEADELYGYMQGFDSKKERRKYLAAGVLSVAAAGALLALRPSFAMVCIAAGIVCLGFNVHRILLVYTVHILKKEIKKEFPKWLFDMLLLLQRESVEGAIFLSVSRASPVLYAELNRISISLQKDPQNADTYLSFLADFGIQNIEDTMRTLYSLSVGTGGDKTEAMGVIIDSNINLLAQAEKAAIEEKGSYSDFIETLPVFAGCGAMMGYTVVLFQVMISYIYTLL